MNDLEMTKLCAEAMGLKPTDWDGELVLSFASLLDSGAGVGFVPDTVYDPLTNDEQAMALVKKFGIVWALLHDGRWMASKNDPITVIHDDLNRAIVECVAKMQMTNAKTKEA